MTRTRTILFGMMMAASALPAFAASARFSISSSEIAAAVFKLGVTIEPGEVTILSDVMANRATPALDVRRVEQFGTNEFMVRVECESSQDCVPFFAKIRAEQASTAQLSKLASGFSPLNGSALSPQPGHSVIRSGAPAILLLDGTHVHIRIPVICLENGAPGQIIRVTDRGHHQTYQAQVVEKDVLQGSLR
jgi:hypothetical protein